MRRISIILAVCLAGVLAYLYVPSSNNRRPEIQTDRVSKTNRGGTDQPHQRTDVNTVQNSQRFKPLNGWARFRGPNGTGISDDKGIPTHWSDEKNLSWKTDLPGGGASSPVLTNEYVFVTSYSGYGMPGQSGGDASKLRRHLSCLARRDGEILWTRSFENEQREDPYQGMGLPEHGYASNTPVTDGQFVFAFLGKSGVVALDMQGAEKWRSSVGTESANRQWGSAASLILYRDTVIVNAAEESRALIALNKTTGEEVWKAEGDALELCYATPAIVSAEQQDDRLIIGVPGEVWCLDPQTGKLRGFLETSLTGNLSPSVNVDETMIYLFGGYRSSGSIAIDLAGNEEISKSNIAWTSGNSSYVATPVLLDSRFYWIDDRGIFYCTDAQTGELVFRQRVQGMGGGRPVYASPIAIAGNLYMQTRESGLYVIQPADQLKIIAQNKFESDKSVFNATPAVDNGQLFLRSDKRLYCIMAE